MGLAFLSAHTLALDVRAGNLVVLDVQGFPAMLSWYLVHNRAKRLAPVAAAFKEFLLSDGAALIERLMPADFSPARAERETPDVRAAKRAKRPE
jgi:hypothetical protein